MYRLVFAEPRPIISKNSCLIDTNGNAKMSKSLSNAVELDSTSAKVELKIRKAVTAPPRIYKHHPEHPDICPIYAYHHAFRPEGAARDSPECSQRAGRLYRVPHGAERASGTDA